MELIKEEKRKEVDEEVRIQVDELMRAELKNLKAVSTSCLKSSRVGKTFRIQFEEGCFNSC